MKVFSFKLILNGQPYRVYSKTYFNNFTFLEYLNYSSDVTIIEYNGQIFPNLFPRPFHKDYIQNKDQLELITVVGGG